MIRHKIQIQYTKYFIIHAFLCCDGEDSSLTETDVGFVYAGFLWWLKINESGINLSAITTYLPFQILYC